MKIKPVKILNVYFLRKLSAMKSDILSLYLPKVQVQSETAIAHKTVLVRLPRLVWSLWTSPANHI